MLERDMRIELTYSAWKADILTVELISHLMSLTALLENYLMVCRLFQGSRALVWTLFTIALFSTVTFCNKDVPRDRFELSTNCVWNNYSTTELPRQMCVSFSVYSWYLHLMERLLSFCYILTSPNPLFTTVSFSQQEYLS